MGSPARGIRSRWFSISRANSEFVTGPVVAKCDAPKSSLGSETGHAVTRSSEDTCCGSSMLSGSITGMFEPDSFSILRANQALELQVSDQIGITWQISVTRSSTVDDACPHPRTVSALHCCSILFYREDGGSPTTRRPANSLAWWPRSQDIDERPQILPGNSRT